MHELSTQPTAPAEPHEAARDLADWLAGFAIKYRRYVEVARQAVAEGHPEAFGLQGQLDRAEPYADEVVVQLRRLAEALASNPGASS